MREEKEEDREGEEEEGMGGGRRGREEGEEEISKNLLIQRLFIAVSNKTGLAVTVIIGIGLEMRYRNYNKRLWIF